MKIENNIPRNLFLEAQSVAEFSKGGWIFQGTKPTIKRNVLRFYGSKNKNNFQREELIMN